MFIYRIGIFSCLMAALSAAPCKEASLRPKPTKETVCCDSPCVDSRRPPPYLEAKMGCFFFTSSTMNDVYDTGGIDVQLSGAYPVYSYLSVYGSVEYLERSGKSENGNQPTSIWEVPLSLGLQPTFLICSNPPIWYYFTLGPRYIFARSHNDSTYVPRHMRSNGFGGFANTGFAFRLNRHLALDVFGEYSYARLDFNSSLPGTQGHTVDVGGLTFGAGFRYTF